MPDIKDVGDVIAIREMKFVSDDERKGKAFLKVGKPFEYNKDWIGAVLMS